MGFEQLKLTVLVLQGGGERRYQFFLRGRDIIARHAECGHRCVMKVKLAGKTVAALPISAVALLSSVARQSPRSSWKAPWPAN